MSELLTSLPGDIPGLLRRGSPVRTMFDGEIVAGLWDVPEIRARLT